MEYKTIDSRCRLVHLEKVDSTNRFMRDFEQTEEEFVVAVADYQTDGRGQRGNSWSSQGDLNLLFSIRAHPTFLESKQQFELSQIISLSIKKVLDHYFDDVKIKWPNDIYWHDKKICGILIENDLQGGVVGRSIIGVGLDVNQERFDEASPNAISMKMITGYDLDLPTLLQDIIDHFICLYNRLRNDEAEKVQSLYRKSLYRGNGVFPYSDANGRFMAAIDHVEPNGIIVLKDEEGVLRRYAFKEVKYE